MIGCSVDASRPMLFRTGKRSIMRCASAVQCDEQPVMSDPESRHTRESGYPAVRRRAWCGKSWIPDQVRNDGLARRRLPERTSPIPPPDHAAHHFIASFWLLATPA